MPTPEDHAMRYQRVIVSRLRDGLSSVSSEIAESFEVWAKPKADSLNQLTEGINGYYRDLLVKHGVSTDRFKVSAPENLAAVPYWIEDLEASTLSLLREANSTGEKNETRS